VWSNDGSDDDELELRVRRACLDHRRALGWEPGPALVRRDALLTVDGLQPGTLAPDLHAGIRLQQLSWHVRSCPVTVFETPGRVNLAATLVARERQSSGRLGLLATSENPLVARGLPWRVRIAFLEELSSVVAGLALPVLAIVVALVLLTGRPPLAADPVDHLVRVLPWALTAGIAHHLLARGWSRFPAGWLRAVRRTGPDLAAMGRACTGRAGVPRYLPRSGADTGGARALLTMLVPAVSLLAMMGAAIVRLADTAFDLALLPSLPGSVAAPVAVVAGAAGLAVGQVLGLVARHRQQRDTSRRSQDIEAALDGAAAVAVDLTPTGAGLRTAAAAAVGESTRITLRLPDASGAIHRVTLPAEVRHRQEAPGGTLVGVRFLPGPAEDEDRLLEYCAVVHPYRELRGVDAPPVMGPVGAREA
jgi:hypothetical protein